MDLPVARNRIGAVVTLTLNRPKAFNVLSVEMMTALREELRVIAGDKSAHVVVIRSEGRGFCAGHDLKEMHERRADKDRGKAFFENLFAQCTDLMTAIIDLPQPVIAEVQGTAAAAGCQLVSSCDMAIAGESARFGVNGIDVGFFCSTPAVALARNIAHKKAMELLTTGRMMSADEARDAGLVNQVVENERLSEITFALAEIVASKPAEIVALGKKAFHQQVQMSLDDAYRLTQEVMVDNLMLDSSVEGFSAFIEKRPPKWPKR